MQDFDGKRLLNEVETLDLVDRVSRELSPPFVAIPERELGNGLFSKHALAKKISANLREKAEGTALHVLGCGNPLSFAILADAGIAMADGLEWCRTLVGPNFHLHHFQHGELFPEPLTDVYNPTAEVIRETSEHYLTRILARNLHALQGFTRLVTDAIETRTLKELVETHFGNQASNVLD